MNRRHIQRLFDVLGVVEQPIVSGVGDHRMHRPGGAIGGRDLLRNALAGKLVLRDTAENPQRIAGRL